MTAALADPALPVTGPGSTTFSFELPILTPGEHEVCLTAFGTDVGGDELRSAKNAWSQSPSLSKCGKLAVA